MNNDELVLGNLVLIGNIAVFFTAVFYSRFVYLHANDLIAIEMPVARVAPAAEGSNERNAELERESVTDDGALQEERILSLGDSTVTQKSSRSSRKKLKKAQKQQRRAA